MDFSKYKRQYKRGLIWLWASLPLLMMQNCGPGPNPQEFLGARNTENSVTGTTTSTTTTLGEVTTTTLSGATTTTTLQVTTTTFMVTTTTTATTTSTTMAPQGRSRPTFNRSTLYTDQGTLLRGSYASLDIYNLQPPSRAQIQNLKAMGLNALHVYAESPGNELPGCGYPAGTKLPLVKSLNQVLKEEGLYMILTIGNGCSTRVNIPGDITNGESIFVPFALDFWNRYAEEFRNDTNVIFEMYNEPYFYFAPNGLIAQPSSPNTIDLMARTYVAVRTKAPQTPILLFSYGTLKDAAAVNSDVVSVTTQIQSLGKSLSNWGIAFHPYIVNIEILAQATRTLIDQGHNVVMTELETVVSQYVPDYCTLPGLPPVDLCVNRELVRLFEGLEVSWLNFVSSKTISDANFRNHINYGDRGLSIVWVPDFGVWPARIAPPAAASIIKLKSYANDNWVSAAKINGTLGVDPLTADRQTAGTSEEFEVLRLGNKVCLKSRANNKIVDPQPASATPYLVASKTTCSADYAMDWLIRPNGKFVLRTSHATPSAINRPSWRFVSTDLNHDFPELISDRLLIGGWEHFMVTGP